MAIYLNCKCLLASVTVLFGVSLGLWLLLSHFFFVGFSSLASSVNVRVSLGPGPYTLILHTFFDGDGDSCALELQILFPR